MKWLENLKNKKIVQAIGLMSGTSVDGLDMVHLRIESTSNGPPGFEVLSFDTKTYAPNIKELILRNMFPNKSSLEEICRLNFELGFLFSDYLLEFLGEKKINSESIDFIGSHGHTLIHLPKREEAKEHKAGTLQVGDPAIIANSCGILTVGDFRIADMALGGEGAPLVPFFDALYFIHPQKNRIVLNIGGIANITSLPVKVEPENIVAFDTGPGNVLIDYFANRYFRMPFDKDGEIAKSGKIHGDLLELLLEEPYFYKFPPKSTGRELFLSTFLEKARDRIEKKRIIHLDVLATVTELTAKTISYAINNLQEQKKWNEILVSGGGVKNQFLMKRLQSYFSDSEILTSEIIGIDPDIKEAACFAILAYFTLLGKPNNVPSATGARVHAILGKVCLPTLN